MRKKRDHLATPHHPSRVQVLTNVSGVFRHSRMIAIMGPSGCGKTTLMNTLCGRAQYGTRRGAVLINGDPLNLPKLKTVMGFVPQDDTVFGDLTVRENISYRYRKSSGQGSGCNTARGLYCSLVMTEPHLFVRAFEHPSRAPSSQRLPLDSRRPKQTHAEGTDPPVVCKYAE